MKSKAPLTLMELLIMVLIFAMAVGFCVRIFVAADLMSQDSDRRDRAVLEVQRVAETVKHFRGNPETIAMYYDENWNRTEKDGSVYYVTVEPTESGQELLGTADVMAGIVDGEELFRVTVGYQEVSGRE